MTTTTRARRPRPAMARDLEASLVAKGIIACEDLPAEAAEAGAPGRIMTAGDIQRFVRAGKAKFTLVSVKTGARFTYRVRLSDGYDIAFVDVLTGADNEADLTYLGNLSGTRYWHGKKSKIGQDAPSARAFDWFARNVLFAGRDPDHVPTQVEVWHEGRCGRCARTLTVPSSVASGYGPECIGRI